MIDNFSLVFFTSCLVLTIYRAYKMDVARRQDRDVEPIDPAADRNANP